jgi:Flp pilus assembly protein TadB
LPASPARPLAAKRPLGIVRKQSPRGIGLEIFKAVLTYVLAFIACMFVVATALQSWPAGMQMLFAFGVPGFVVWWRSAQKAF